MRASIWVCSDPPTTSFGVCNLWLSRRSSNKRRFMTAHHMGIVLLKASGMLLPRRVESTITQLPRPSNVSPIIPFRYNYFAQGYVLTHPPNSPIVPKIWRFSRRILKRHCPQCPSVLLKYTLPAFCSGGMYQLPQRSFAIRGKLKLRATSWTKIASWWIDCKRLLVESVKLLREERVLERFCEAVGRRREAIEFGKEVVAAIDGFLETSYAGTVKCCFCSSQWRIEAAAKTSLKKARTSSSV